jgi:general secretion pathway protein C
MKRLPLLMTLLALVLLAASIAYWVLQLYQPPQRPLAPAPVASRPEPSADAAATLFGGEAAAAVVSNYQLTGVVADGRDSVAILVADGSPPKAIRVGREVAPGVTVSQVHPRYVMLSDGGVMKRVELATDATAGTSLSIVGAGHPGAAPGAPGAAGGPGVAGGRPPNMPEPPMAPGAVQQGQQMPEVVPADAGPQPAQGANQPPPPPPPLEKPPPPPEKPPPPPPPPP